MSKIDISTLDPNPMSAFPRPYIDIAIRVSHMKFAPKDGRRILAWSGNKPGHKHGENEWIPIWWNTEPVGISGWYRCDGGSMWLSGNTDWTDTLMCWVELPQIEAKTEGSDDNG